MFGILFGMWFGDHSSSAPSFWEKQTVEKMNKNEGSVLQNLGPIQTCADHCLVADSLQVTPPFVTSAAWERSA